VKENVLDSKFQNEFGFLADDSALKNASNFSSKVCAPL
jgi:hypothetical protein